MRAQRLLFCLARSLQAGACTSPFNTGTFSNICSVKSKLSASLSRTSARCSKLSGLSVRGLQVLGARSTGDVHASVFRQVKRNEQGSEKVNTLKNLGVNQPNIATEGQTKTKPRVSKTNPCSDQCPQMLAQASESSTGLYSL